MKKTISVLLALAMAFALAACVSVKVAETPFEKNREAEAVVTEGPTAAPTAVPTAEPTPEPTKAPTPEPTPTPTEAPTPEPEPTEVPKLRGAYQSDKYPLTEKSRRTVAGGMYPEEQRLNNDPDKFRCVVDLTNQCVFIYEKDKNGGYTVLVREMIASCGTAQNPTPTGVFHMQNDYKRFGYFVRFYCYAQYWSLVVGKIYFHSIPYLERDSRSLDVEGFYQLGSPASHGCIRLLPDDAHWVYLYLCPGTTVEITRSRPYDKELRARLLLIELPVPDAYEIVGK